MCLRQGCVPDDLKVARVTPIYKSGSKDDFSNYRPISIVPICSKILEKIVHKQLYVYVSDNQLMYDGQSGFRKHHSTCTALIKTIDKWNMEIDKGNYVGAVFVDLSKAFDMVNHTLLIDKLSSLGITGIENRWFQSYLNNRTQCVSLNGTISTPNVIRSGVPQGSILGPLLFLLFINDMPKNIVNCSIDMYADDTLIYVCHNDIDVIEKCLNEDLASLSKCLDRNVMKANVSKTKTMILGTPPRISRIRDVNIIMNGIAVERVNTFKYLGITIDANLQWNDQINNICRKMCNSLGIMRRIKPFVPQSSLVTIYNTMFLPHLDYGIILWSNCGNTNLSRIQKLQNTAMRIILSAPFRTHINDMLKTLGFMDVRNRISYVTGCMMYKVINGMTPGGGVLSPKSYVDVPAGPRKSDYLYTNFLPNFPPISIPFSKEKHPIWIKLGAFYNNLPKIHPIYVIWAPSSLMKTPRSLYQISRKSAPKRQAHIRIPCQCENPPGGMTPSYLNQLFNYVNNIHSLCTRKSKAGDLYTPKCNTNYGRNTFQYKGCVLWNVISRNIRNANTFMSFKMNFKKDLKL